MPVEPQSMEWPSAVREDRRFKKDETAMDNLMNSIPIAGIRAENCDVVFMSGGWGAA
jgi:hypothetical protein